MSTATAMPNADLVLYYEVTGSGSPVVLLHGLGSSARDWEHQVDTLSRHHTVIAVDLRGHGKSVRAPGPYSIPLLAGDVVAAMTRLGLDDAHICGISLGGMVAFQMAVDAPDRVRSLAIINSGPAFPGRSLKGRLTLWTRLAMIRWKGLPALGAMVAQRLFPSPGQEALRQRFVARFAENDRASYEHTLRAIGRFDVADRIDRIRCPVLVMASDRDYTPVAAKEAYARRLSDAHIVVIRDSGHASPMDQPAAVNTALLDFWRQVASTRR